MLCNRRRYPCCADMLTSMLCNRRNHPCCNEMLTSMPCNRRTYPCCTKALTSMLCDERKNPYATDAKVYVVLVCQHQCHATDANTCSWHYLGSSAQHSAYHKINAKRRGVIFSVLFLMALQVAKSADLRFVRHGKCCRPGRLSLLCTSLRASSVS